MKHTRHTRRGFTLTELLVVVTVLMILAVTAIPSFRMSEKRKLDTFQLQVQDAIDFAQSLSYHTGAKYGVKFDPEGMWLAVVNELGVPMVDPLTRDHYIVRFDRPDQPSGLRMEVPSFVNGRPLLAFNDKGILTQGGSCRLRAGDSTRNLSINTATAKLFESPIGE